MTVILIYKFRNIFIPRLNDVYLRHSATKLWN